MYDTNLLIAAGLILLLLVAVIFFIIKKRKNRVTSSQPADLKLKLSKTKNGILGKLAEIVKLRGKVDEDLLDDLEEMLIKSDIGVETSVEIIDQLRQKVRTDQIVDVKEIQNRLKSIIRSLLLADYADSKEHFQLDQAKPFIFLFAGVNGVGKTTTIGKLAKRYTKAGLKVRLIAADTFRAAAIEQLTIWAERANAEITKHQHGADPASVIYEGVMKAVKEQEDVVLIDTAGRQHTKVNLMKELSKIIRTIQKIVPDGPHETMMVVDATTGQNAIEQSKLFNEAAKLSGLVLTKLDGTAKGGIVIGIKHQLNIPVKLIGVGEQEADLRDFEIDDFIEAIFE
ncbi:MAG: signal recognition particle-docking protein FtsY [Candidatus Cloacimonadales bacterium]